METPLRSTAIGGVTVGVDFATTNTGGPALSSSSSSLSEEEDGASNMLGVSGVYVGVV